MVGGISLIWAIPTNSHFKCNANTELRQYPISIAIPQNWPQNNGLQGITLNFLGLHNGLLGHCSRETK